MKTFTILMLVALFLTCAGEAEASHWVVDTTITIDTVETTYKPAASTDDGHTSTSSVFYTTSYVPVRNTYSPRGPGFTRFPDVAVEQGATITTAKWRQYGSNIYADSIDMYIHYEDTANAATLQSTDQDEIMKRAWSADSIYWNAVDNGGGWEDSPSLVDLLEVLFAREDWESGNAVALSCWYKASPTFCNWQFQSWDAGDQNYSSQLVLGAISADTTFDSVLVGEYSVYISGTDSIDDTHLLSDAGFQDYSSGNINHVFTLGGATPRHGCIRVNTPLADLLPEGGTLVSFACSTWANSASAGQKVYAYEGLNYWHEGAGSESSCADSGASWNDAACPDRAWGKAGADSTDDAGLFGWYNGDGPDRKATPEDSVTVLGSSLWHRFMFDSLGQRYADGRSDQRGGIILEGGWLSFNSTENADSNQVFFVLTYDLPEEEAQKYTRFRRP
jgi:hypothetical protein